MEIAFTLNGAPRRLTADADARLVTLLRERLDLRASKLACGIGRCGACMVLLDGQPANACLLMAWQVDGRAVTTPEGLESGPAAATAQRIRASLAAENAFQCGYCASGVVASLTALFEANQGAGEAEIRRALEGHVCRCTGYHSIIRGALAAGAALRARSEDTA